MPLEASSVTVCRTALKYLKTRFEFHLVDKRMSNNCKADLQYAVGVATTTQGILSGQMPTRYQCPCLLGKTIREKANIQHQETKKIL